MEKKDAKRKEPKKPRVNRKSRLEQVSEIFKQTRSSGLKVVDTVLSLPVIKTRAVQTGEKIKAGAKAVGLVTKGDFLHLQNRIEMLEAELAQINAMKVKRESLKTQAAPKTVEN